MDMLDDISKELPTNGLKVADLINAFNARLGYVSTALAQLDRKQDIIESKLEKKLDEQDKALDAIQAIQARAPTRADLAELQAQQMRRETYEVAHQALIAQIASILADVIGVKAEMKATEARTAKNVQTADELHRDHGDTIKALDTRLKLMEGAPRTRRSVLALYLTGIGIGVALLCSGAGTLVSVVALVLQQVRH